LISPYWSFDEQQEARMSLRTFKNLLYKISIESMLQPTLTEVLTTIAQYQEDPNLELPVVEENLLEDAVQIMTVHASKGLERPIVFVAYAETDRASNTEDALLIFDPQYDGKPGFGLILGKDWLQDGEDTLKKQVYHTVWRKPREENEKKRLFYVALTRAQERLYVIRARQSAHWSAPEHFQNQDLLPLNEAEQPALFHERYWDVNMNDLRTQVEALLEKQSVFY
jgi:ATP-dependent exoDNAse (exonuclease V) beta subunit